MHFFARVKQLLNPADAKKKTEQSFEAGFPNRGGDSMKKVKILVKGYVQGVGFRYTTKMVADELGIAGIVRNESDGSVYIEAAGEPEKIDAFIKAVQNSPSPSGKVEQVVVEEDDSLTIPSKFSVTN